MRNPRAMITPLLGMTLFVSGARPLAQRHPETGLRSTIAFSSTRHDTATYLPSEMQRAFQAAEIYLMDGDGGNVRRLTHNAYFDGFAALSPDGSRIIFESNRLRSGEDALNVSELFVMNSDGTGETALVPGSSATWSPDGKMIAFHASASGKGTPLKIDPGAATTDNDIFVLNIAEFLAHTATPRNITNNPAMIDDDPDWSPQGQKIVFTSHDAKDDPMTSNSAEIYVIDLGGTAKPVRLTNNTEEERAPSWSPDGKRIVYHRRVGERGQFQLFVINEDGSNEKQLTFPPGVSGFPHWGELRVPKR